MTSQQRWLDIEDAPFYQVSDGGQVRSTGRRVTYSDGRSRWYPGQQLAQTRNPGGYYKVNLYVGGARRTEMVHLLVARAFLGPCPPGQQCRHGPAGQADNAVTNLSYGTPRQNSGQDKRRDGGLYQLAKVRCPRRHLLRAPNLIPNRRKRACLACAKASDAVRYARRAGRELNWQLEADWRYEAIMADEVER
jgi:hypothetical protein